MWQDIFQKFGVKEIDLANANILGMDYGDGEIAVCEAFMERDVLNITKHLYLTNALHEKDVTAYYEDKNLRLTGKDAVDRAGAENPRGLVYVNFKRPLDGDRGKQQYAFANEHVHTYEEVMRLHFQAVINNVFINNKRLYNNKHTVIFVGRPASQIWEETELQYAMLLKDKLRVHGYTDADDNRSVDIVIYSEAQAALANEYHNKNIKARQSAIIIDGGSSTFDAVAVKDGKIVFQYSRQIGARMIERNMLDLFLINNTSDVYKLENERRGILKAKNLTEMSEGLILLFLRRIKEEYFGTNGKNGNRRDLRLTINVNSKDIRKDIDESFMRLAIEAMPVCVKGSYSDGGNLFEEEDFPSFYHAVDKFFEVIFNYCKKYNFMPDKIILSGGATVMPFIRKLAEKRFGARMELTRSDFPSFGVAEGLAYMGYAELIKAREMKLLIKEKKTIMDGWKTSASMESKIRDALFDSFWNKRFVDELNRWKESADTFSMEEWFKNKQVDIPFSVIATSVKEELAAVLKALNDTILCSFKALIPDLKAHEKYAFEIKEQDIKYILKSLPAIELDGDIWTYRGFGGSFTQWILSLFQRCDIWAVKYTQKERQKIANGMVSRKEKIREDFNNKVSGKKREVSSLIFSTLDKALDKELKIYIDSLTPYLAQYGPQYNVFPPPVPPPTPPPNPMPASGLAG